MNRDPVVTILMAVAGVILLLPGVCAVLVIASGGEGYRVPGGSRGFDFSLIPLWLVCFLISAGGGWLLYKAFQKPPNPTP
jgi:hypothetical protein